MVLAVVTKFLGLSGPSDYEVLELSKRELLPEKCIFSVATDDGTIFYYRYHSPQRLYTKWNGKEIDAAFFPDNGLAPMVAKGDALYFKKGLKIYKAEFSPPDAITVSYARDKAQNEEVQRSGMISGVRHGILSREYVYRMGDDSLWDAVTVNVPIDQLEGLKLETIHRGKVIFFSFDNDISYPKVRELCENVLVIELASASSEVSNAGTYPTDPNFPFFFVEKRHILHAFDTEKMEFLPPLRFEGYEVINIVGILNGVMTVDAVEEGSRDYYLMTATLPVDYIEKADPVDSYDLITKARAARTCRDGAFESEFLAKFVPMKVLGVGGFGSVFLAKNVTDNCNYAVKRVALTGGDNRVNECLEEVRTLAALRHEGIVGYNSAWVERPPHGWQKRADAVFLEKIDYGETLNSFKKDSVFIYIQMELCKQSLHEWLRENSERSLYQAKDWFRQLVSAVGYLHRKKKIHRDLKPQNVLFGEDGRLKICDLGLVAEIAMQDEEEVCKSRTAAGTECYMAPEQVRGRYTSSVDIFSLGLILIELCVKMTTTERYKVFADHQNGRQNGILRNQPEVAKFVSLLTNLNASARPTCEEILQYPFLA